MNNNKLINGIEYIVDYEKVNNLDDIKLILKSMRYVFTQNDKDNHDFTSLAHLLKINSRPPKQNKNKMKKFEIYSVIINNIHSSETFPFVRLFASNNFNEVYEEYIKYSKKEPCIIILNKLSKDIENLNVFIYESPDGGKTITRRKFGKDEKEIIKSSTATEIVINYSDLLKNKSNINHK